MPMSSTKRTRKLGRGVDGAQADAKLGRGVDGAQADAKLGRGVDGAQADAATASVAAIAATMLRGVRACERLAL